MICYCSLNAQISSSILAVTLVNSSVVNAALTLANERRRTLPSICLKLIAWNTLLMSISKVVTTIQNKLMPNIEMTSQTILGKNISFDPVSCTLYSFATKQSVQKQIPRAFLIRLITPEYSSISTGRLLWWGTSFNNVSSYQQLTTTFQTYTRLHVGERDLPSNIQRLKAVTLCSRKFLVGAF